MKCSNKGVFEKQNVFGMGEPNTTYAKYFIGESFLNPLTDPKSGLFAANVTFEPGCRNNWLFIIRQKAVDNFFFASLVKDGIRKKVKRPLALRRAV